MGSKALITGLNLLVLYKSVGSALCCFYFTLNFPYAIKTTEDPAQVTVDMGQGISNKLDLGTSKSD